MSDIKQEVRQEAKQAAAGTIFNFVLGLIGLVIIISGIVILTISLRDDYVEHKAAKREALDERILDTAVREANREARESRNETRRYVDQEIRHVMERISNIVTMRKDDAELSVNFPVKDDPNFVIDWRTD